MGSGAFLRSSHPSEGKKVRRKERTRERRKRRKKE